MDNIEKLLQEEKEKLKHVKAPENFETQLRSTLNNVNKPKRKGLKIKIASLILAIIIGGYNMDTLAYYARKLVGYDNVMTGTLRELNELGQGQIIDKSHTFGNGLKVTLDGIMLDDNNIIVFYSLYSPDGKIYDKESNISVNIYGWGGRSIPFGGQGEASEDGKEVKWVISSNEPLKLFENKLMLKAILSDSRGPIDSAEIPVKIDRAQALGKSVKLNINKSAKIDNRKIRIDFLTASPTTTVIKGQVQNILELGFDYLTENRVRPENIEFKLLADGIEIDNLGSGMSTNLKGIHFESRFDALPRNVKKVELILVSFTGDHDVRERIPLTKGESKTIDILGQYLEINDVSEKDGYTFVTITTDEMTRLGKVSLNIDGNLAKLEETTSEGIEKNIERQGARIEYTRRLKFKGSGRDLSLNIDSIRYNKTYNKLIYKHSL